MSLSEEPILPTEPNPEPLPPPRRDANRRRRATRRSMFPTDAEGQAALIYDLSRRAYPSIELFVLSLACGAILGLGYFLDSQAVLLLGILAAPLMTPWVGFLLSILTGSPRFFFETFMALLISAVLVFLGGSLIGVIIRFIEPRTLDNVYTHSRLWPPDLAVLIIGAITLVVSFIRSESKPILPSVLIAYMFYLPINAAGFGVGSGLPTIWPQAIYLFLTHFAFASIIGLITLFAFRFRTSMGGVVFSTVMLLVFAALLVIFMMPGLPLPNPFAQPTATLPASTATLEPTLIPSLTPSPTIAVTSSPTVTKTTKPSATATKGTATITSTGSDTATKTITSTATTTSTATLTETVTPTVATVATSIPPTLPLTLTATPQLTTGTIKASEGGGANLRQTPNGKYLMTLDNGTAVEIYPDFKTVNGVAWIHVAVTRNGQRVEGWLLESVVSYSTPAPNFNPSATPTTGITPAP
jgi:hypothetical protein